MTEVHRYAREIVPTFNAYIYFRVGYSIARAVARFLYRVRLGFADERTMAGVAPGTTVVFVMNHRSNMDYVLVAFLAAERTALCYAVGEWARIWPLQQLIRSMGAYFVRRNSNNPIYRRVLERYVHMATEAGVAQAMYPEGGLSRDGKLREPKLGLFDYMLKSFDPKGDHDIVFVPVALNYDRVLEDRTLLRSLDKELPRRSALVRRAHRARLLVQPARPDAARPLVSFRLCLREFRRAHLRPRLARQQRGGVGRRSARPRQGPAVRGHRPAGQGRHGRDRPPGAGAAGVGDRHRVAGGQGAARRARAQGAGLRSDGAFRGSRRQALSCRAATATMPSMSGCACWRCAIWSRSPRKACSRRWPANARCSPTTPTPSPICADDAASDAAPSGAASHALEHRLLGGPGLLHQPAVDLGRGHGLLHHVRHRPDHDLQHHRGRTDRRAADGAGSGIRRARHRAAARPARGHPPLCLAGAVQGRRHGGHHRRARAGLYGQPRLRRARRQHQRHLEHARGACAASGEPLRARAGDPAVAAAGAGDDDRARPSADRGHPGERSDLGLCRRAREIPAAGRVDRAGDIGVHALRPAVGASSP